MTERMIDGIAMAPIQEGRNARIRGRRKSYTGDRSLNRDIDDLDTPLQLEVATEAIEGATVLNNGSGAVRADQVYGRDGNGEVTAAIALGTTIDPVWVATRAAGEGDLFTFVIHGPALVTLENAAVAITIGGIVWLSTSNAGKVTPTIPSGAGHKKWMMGRFADDLVDDEGRVQVDVQMFQQSSGGL
jgi:hypothetical protein